MLGVTTKLQQGKLFAYRVQLVQFVLMEPTLSLLVLQVIIVSQLLNHVTDVQLDMPVPVHHYQLCYHV